MSNLLPINSIPWHRAVIRIYLLPCELFFKNLFKILCISENKKIEMGNGNYNRD
jgi:hypothetical protein